MKVDHRQLQTIFWRDGAKGVALELEKASVSDFTLRRAVREMWEDATAAEHRATIEELQQFLRSLGHLSSNHMKPDAGEERDYSAFDQQNRVVATLPMDHLGVTSGKKKIRARFLVDSIVVTAVDNADTGET